jgi:serine/threonine-protein kinase HipA
MDNEWKLSPAYDLLPDTPLSIEERFLALSCGDQGRLTHVDNLLSQCARFLLKQDEATAIIDAMEQTVRDRWYEIARREGVSETDCEKIRLAFVYEGFRLEIAGEAAS